MSDSNEERIKTIEQKVDRLNEVVFNGYGERIKDTQKHVAVIELKLETMREELVKKWNWIIITASGAVIVFLLDILVTKVA